MNGQTTEVFLYLHSIENGLASFSVLATQLGARKKLPIHSIEIIADPEKPRKCLVKMPRWLADGNGLLPATQGIATMKTELEKLVSDSIGGREPKPGEVIEVPPDRLKEALAAERSRAGEARRGPRFRPASDSVGNSAGGLLSSHRARSQVEQIADSFDDSVVEDN